MSMLRNLLPSLWGTLLPRRVFYEGVSDGFHTLSQSTAFIPNLQSKLLQAPDVRISQTCGFKVRGTLKRRCKDCYFVVRQQRLYVICETHPRHKQMSMVKDEKHTWILTHATQGKVRPW